MIALSRHSSIAKAAVPAVYRLFNITLSRFFSTASAAAEAQLDPDYYYYNEPPRRNPLGAMDDTENSVPGRGVQWAFIGSPRAKKRVYAETLSKLLEVPCISMASLARQELNPRSSLYKQIANAVNRRMLVPEDIIFGLLSKRLEDGYYKGETGFILDGIPRSRLQAEILDQLVEIDLVVNFRCTDDYLVKHQQEGVWKESVYAEQIEVNSFKFVLCNSCCEDTKDGRQSLGAADIQLIDGVHHLLFPGPELHTASSKECPQMMDGSMIQNKCICSLW